MQRDGSRVSTQQTPPLHWIHLSCLDHGSVGILHLMICTDHGSVGILHQSCLDLWICGDPVSTSAGARGEEGGMLHSMSCTAPKDRGGKGVQGREGGGGEGGSGRRRGGGRGGKERERERKEGK